MDFRIKYFFLFIQAPGVLVRVASVQQSGVRSVVDQLHVFSDHFLTFSGVEGGSRNFLVLGLNSIKFQQTGGQFN